MSSWRAFCNAVHLTALGLWTGAVVTSAATAAVAFPTMKALDEVMGVKMTKFPAEFEADHYRFAAGAIAQRVFFITDIVAFACAMLAAPTLILLIAVFKASPKRPATVVRSIALAVAVASLAALLLVVTPQINTASEMHYQAAKAGDTAAAKVHKQAVDDLHPMAANLLTVEVAALLISLFAGAWSLSTAAPPEKVIPIEPYPEPQLLRSKRN